MEEKVLSQEEVSALFDTAAEGEEQPNEGIHAP